MSRRYMSCGLVLLCALLCLLCLHQWYSHRGSKQVKDLFTNVVDLSRRIQRATNTPGVTPSGNSDHLSSLESHQRKQTDNKHPSSRFSSLPQEIIDSVKHFVFFIGYARSGHSIVGSMLDAHPHIVIAHEYDLFKRWNTAASCHVNRECLFNALYKNTRHSINEGVRNQQSLKKGYTLAIPGWWQGKYQDSIAVIGDKSGGKTANTYRINHSNFFALYTQLEETVRVPIKVIHVVRNPYDNIATMLLYNMHVKWSRNVSKHIQKYSNYAGLKKQIIAYFNQAHSVMEIIEKLKLNVTVIEVHNADFIHDPKETMSRICHMLEVTCSERYLQMCASNVFTEVSKSRRLVQWWPDLINLVADKMKAFEHLRRYSLYSE